MENNVEVFDEQQIAMLKRKAVIWSTALVAVVLFFFWGIPIDYMKSMLTLLAILAGISITVCFFMTYFAIRFLLVPSKKNNSYEGYIIFGFILLILFGSAVLMITQEIHLEKQEIFKYGVMTDATVEGGSSFSTRKIDLTKIKLVFTMANGEEYTVYEGISHENFDRFYQGQKVSIIYSPRYPTIMEILYRPEDVEKFREMIHNRKK
ncbi:hypothetical protein ACVW0P_000593 [Mucilaginibacter sp. UYNi724]